MKFVKSLSLSTVEADIITDVQVELKTKKFSAAVTYIIREYAHMRNEKEKLVDALKKCYRRRNELEEMLRD